MEDSPGLQYGSTGALGRAGKRATVVSIGSDAFKYKRCMVCGSWTSRNDPGVRMVRCARAGEYATIFKPQEKGVLAPICCDECFRRYKSDDDFDSDEDQTEYQKLREGFAMLSDEYESGAPLWHKWWMDE